MASHDLTFGVFTVDNVPAVVTTATDQTHARFNETFIIPSHLGPI